MITTGPLHLDMSSWVFTGQRSCCPSKGMSSLRGDTCCLPTFLVSEICRVHLNNCISIFDSLMVVVCDFCLQETCTKICVDDAFASAQTHKVLLVVTVISVDLHHLLELVLRVSSLRTLFSLSAEAFPTHERRPPVVVVDDVSSLSITLPSRNYHQINHFILGRYF